MKNKQPLQVLYWLFLLSLISLFELSSSETATKYKIGEIVPVSVNTVGPYRNPNEKYAFFEKIPFCTPKRDKNDLIAGSVFMGDRAKLSDYILPFAENMHENQIVCTKTLDQNEIKKYRKIISDNYMFEFFVDHSLLITGFLGKEESSIEQYDDHHHNEKHFYLFTHWNFHCEYNSGHVISCKITTDLDKQVALTFGEDLPIDFTYSVLWSETDVSVNDRLMYHVRKLVQSQPLEVHWLSTLNSFILVILVTAFVTLVFTTILRQDCARYMTRDDLEDVGDPGWKQLSKDVFRSPNNILLFSSIIGCGTQLLVISISLLLLSLIGLFYPGNRGSIISSIIFVYCFTSGIAGHVSSTLYHELGGDKWATNCILTASIFSMPFFCIFIIVNSIAIYYESSIALPFTTILSVFLLWIIVTLPLTIYASRRVHTQFENRSNQELTHSFVDKTHISRVAREIPKLPWFRHSIIQIVLSGILPFTSIYIELHFLFMAIFGHQVYTLFGILSLAFIMLLIVTCAVTIGLTYFQLQSEDWRWWWTSLLTGGSTGLYIFGYSIFYYLYRSYMTGILQCAIFFGYVIAVSYAAMLMLGATAWWSTFVFLKKIYGAIKSE